MKGKQLITIALTGLALIIFAVGCSEQKSPTDIKTHPDGWTDVSSPLFHGKTVEANQGIAECMQCHGSTLNDGGKANVACTECHNAKDVEDPLKHAARVRKLGWDLTSCTYCHGDNFKGQLRSADCTQCHERKDGPEACITCHGNFSKTYSTDAITPMDIAPPLDLQREKSPISIGVGLHQFHLKQGLTCTACHTHPVNNFNDPTHIDGDGIADVGTQLVVSWDRDTNTCMAVCHRENGEFVPMPWAYR